MQLTKKMFAQVIALVLFSNLTFAQTDSAIILTGDKAISQTQATIVSIDTASEKNLNGSMVKILVTLPGCLDRLAGYNFSFEEINGKGVVFFNALSFFNKASSNARCFVANQKSISVFVPFEGDIELKTLNFVKIN